MGSCHLTLFKFLFLLFSLFLIYCSFCSVDLFLFWFILTIYFLMRRAFSVPLCSI